jgi:hypothetical protein
MTRSPLFHKIDKLYYTSNTLNAMIHEYTLVLLRKVVVGVGWITILDIQERLATPTVYIVLDCSAVVHLTTIPEIARL